jgi:uncharacterized protein YpbB
MMESIYKLDFHVAERTGAKTVWRVELKNGAQIDIMDAVKSGILKLIKSTLTEKKTHWTRYVSVVKPEKINCFIRIRISNRGNFHVAKYDLNAMDQFFKCNSEEYEILKLVGGGR